MFKSFGIMSPCILCEVIRTNSAAHNDMWRSESHCEAVEMVSVCAEYQQQPDFIDG